jgi:hypothetical protein
MNSTDSPAPPSTLRRYRLICCEILFREACLAMSQVQSVVDPEFLPKGLHDMGEAGMSAHLQSVIDTVDPDKYDAILLGYGLCNYGTRGLHSTLPLVLPRAHDCITLLLGSKECYRKYFDANPGTIFKSPGWIERDADPNASPASVTSKLGLSRNRDELAELYGEENVDFLISSMGDWLVNYRKLALIDTAVGDVEQYRRMSEELADSRKWEFELVPGNIGLLIKLMSGDWPEEDFLVVPAGQTIAPSWDDRIVCTQSCHK